MHLNVDHVSRNCPKFKPCFYCKGMHNSAICNNKKDNQRKTATIDSYTNYAFSFSSIRLPITDIVLEDSQKKQEVRVAALFQQSLQRAYVTQGVKNILQLAPIYEEKISISTFENKECESKTLEKVSVHL